MDSFSFVPRGPAAALKASILVLDQVSLLGIWLSSLSCCQIVTRTLSYFQIKSREHRRKVELNTN